MLPSGACRKASRRIYLAEDANKRSVLFRQRNDRLRLDGSNSQGLDDRYLHLWGSFPSRAKRPRIWNRDIACNVDALIRKGNEVSRTNAGFDRNEQSARSRLEDGYAHDIADPESDFFRRRTAVRKRDGKSRRFPGENRNDVWRELD